MLEVVAAPSDGAEPTVVAYLGTGEVLGELALLTGSPRSATVRSPEHAELFTVDKAVFLDLMDVLPAFARNLCVVLARRLETTTLKVPRASGKQLQGNLRYFDLATVIQTLIGSHQTGTLVVTQEGQAQARRDLLLQGQHRARQGTGSSRATTRCSSSSRARSRATSRSPGERERGGGADRHHDARDLAAHGVGAPAGRAADAAASALPDPDRVFRQKAAQLDWEEPETVELAASVWSRLKKGATSPTCTATSRGARTRSTGRS